MYSEPNKFLVIVLVTSVLSYLYCLVIVFLYKNIGGSDKALNKVQSVHAFPTPRLGGVALILAIISVEVIFVSFLILIPFTNVPFVEPPSSIV